MKWKAIPSSRNPPLPSRMTSSLLPWILLLASLIILPDCHGDICTDPMASKSSIAQFIHQGAAPQGGVLAGVYFKDLEAANLADCLLSCCDRDTCNVMFFHQETCFLIQCNTTSPDACEPLQRPEKKFQDSYMINVRTLEETNPLIDVDAASQSGTGSSSGSQVPVYNECSVDTDSDCAEHETCRLRLNDDVIGFVCQCDSGYVRLHDDEPCVAKVISGESDRSLDVSCEAGLEGECLEHETCTPKNSRTRSGTCLCDKGFRRNPDSGWCENDEQEVGEGTEGEPIEKKNENVQTEPGSSNLPTAVTSSTVTSSTVPPAPTTTQKPKLEPLVVSAGDNKEIQLPTNDVTLSAFVVPKDSNNEYSYLWTLLEHPSGDHMGEMTGINTDTLHLTELILGLYTFKVAVTAEGKFGEAYVNVSVSPPARENQAPTSIIKPPSQQVNQPNDVVLDGSESVDDDKIVKYHWEQVSGPMDSQSSIDEGDMDKNMLILKGLGPGLYKFKLTVTDSDGALDSTFANVTVIKETDYPPKANAGSNVIINLPQNSVTLYGNASTDDKGILNYEWIKKTDDKLTADVTGVRTPVLHLEHLEVGDYTFTLKVTDTSGQVDTADVRVYVKPESNKPPVAQPGPDRTVFLPSDVITLDGSNSTDDQKVASYKWTQVSGPHTLEIDNADRAVATASKAVVGKFTFRLTVADKEGLQGTSTVTITVKQDANQPPVARAGGSRVVTMPAPLVLLDGSKSADDRGVTSYLWTRDGKSLAAGIVVNQSDHQAVLQLADLVAGRYQFTLKVMDAEGLSATDTASLIVRPEENRVDLVELHLATSLNSFTEDNKKRLESQISLLLHSHVQETSTHVVIKDLVNDVSTGNLIVIFYAETVSGHSSVVVPGPEVMTSLRNKLRSDGNLIDFKIVKLDTLVCQNNCSGHGHCDQSTKLCVCEAFWMENPLGVYVLDAQRNCEWSVLYVIIVVFVVLVFFIACSWGTVFFCRRWYKSRPKKRHRYTLLDEADQESNDRVEMLPKGRRRKRTYAARSPPLLGAPPGGENGDCKIQQSSLMVSESDFSSDEETLFINKKANGHTSGRNGLVKGHRNRIRT